MTRNTIISRIPGMYIFGIKALSEQKMQITLFCQASPPFSTYYAKRSFPTKKRKALPSVFLMHLLILYNLVSCAHDSFFKELVGNFL